MPTQGPRIALIADRTSSRANEAVADLTRRYSFVGEPDADVGVVVGGDGFMLHTLHRLLAQQRSLPLYGLNCGTVGFLLNRYRPQDLSHQIAAARPTVLHPLQMRAALADDSEVTRLAINEVSLFRRSAQTARIRVVVDGAEQIADLLGDGIIVATAAGSTAYNRSAGGPVIPVAARLLAVTPVAAFRPRSWRGALLASSAQIRLDVIDRVKRPVNAAADRQEVDDVRTVVVTERADLPLTLLFDENHTLENRILAEQFH